MRTLITLLDKQGKNAVARVIEVLSSLSAEKPLRYGLVSSKKSLFGKSLKVLEKQAFETSTLIGYATTQPPSTSDYQILNLDETALLFEGTLYSPVYKDAVMEQVAKQPLHCETTLQTLIEQADGDYSFLMLKEGWIAAGRDPIGVKPLYYGENKDIAALASNRKALWKLGIENALSFPPGNLAFVNREGFKFKPVKTLIFEDPKPVTLTEAAEQLQMLLEQTVQRRVHGLKEVAVAFSGGLDSSLIAFLTSKIGVRVNLLHVSLENQLETEEAIEAAEALGLPMQIYLFKESDVEATLPKVIELIEEADPVKASIGVPFYWVSQKTAETGFRVLLAGQGADELFGGYQRYVNEYCKYGGEKTCKMMFEDVAGIHESNLERDFKITAYYDVELRLPFASFELAKYILGLPVELKIEKKADTLRKLVLRKVASNMGLPARTAEKPKKAVQYSTGINNALKRIAKKHGKTVNEYIKELFAASKQ